MMGYFREVMPILMRLVTHPEFDVEQFAQRHPDSPFGRMHLGFIQYLESQRERARIVAENVGPAALSIFDEASIRAMLSLDRTCPRSE